MTKLFVKLQTPTIEILLTAKDASGKKDSIVVGFNRYETEQSNVLLLELQNLFEAQMKDIDNIDTLGIDSFIKDRVVYIKKISLVAIIDGNETSLSIQDTRKSKPVADCWETPEECLDALLNMYLVCSPWRSAFNKGVQQALVNTDQEEDTIKN